MPGPRSIRSFTAASSLANMKAFQDTSRPVSPTFSETTNASQMNLGPSGPEVIITRADLKTSQKNFETLLNSCAEYRAALLTMSKATAGFADAMEKCSGLKGASYESGTRLQAASGLHHLMGNHWHVLSDTLDQNFEKPLKQYLDNYRAIVADRSASYERALRERSQIIRKTEQENMNINGKKRRNLQSFREALSVLQRQVDELDELKASHYQEIVEHEEEVWDFVQGKVALVVRSTLEVFDRFAAKSSDPVLEPMLNSIPDPFNSYGPPKAEDEIFSILPPLGIMNAPSPSPSPLASTPPKLNNTQAFTGSTTAWMDDTQAYASLEWAGVASPTVISPRPTSPASVASSSSTAKRPTSPSNSITRPHSYPSSTNKNGLGYQPRKAETKLRSVLSVIDESSTHRGSTSIREASEDTVRAPSPESDSEPPSQESRDGVVWGPTAIAHNESSEPDHADHLAEVDVNPANPPTTRSPGQLVWEVGS